MVSKTPALTDSNQNTKQPTENTKLQPDLINTLPQEVLVMIFSYLSESFQDLGHVAQVCQLWNQVSVNSWKCINLGNLFPFVSSFKEVSDGQVKLPILNIPFPISQTKQIIKIQICFKNMIFQAFNRYHVNGEHLLRLAVAQLIRANVEDWEEADKITQPIAKTHLYKLIIDQIFNNKVDPADFFKAVNADIEKENLPTETQLQIEQANEQIENIWLNNKSSKNKIVNILINQYPSDIFISPRGLSDSGLDIDISQREFNDSNIKSLISLLFLQNIERSKCNEQLDSLHLKRIITHVNNFGRNISVQNGSYTMDYQSLEKDWLSEQNKKELIQTLNQDGISGSDIANELHIGDSVISHSASKPLDDEDETANDLLNLVDQILAKELHPHKVAFVLRRNGGHQSAKFIEDLIQQHNLL